MPSSQILRVSCSDRSGLIALISRHIAECGANIVTLHESVERGTGAFFARVEVEGGIDSEVLEERLQAELPEAEISFGPLRRKKVVLLGTKEPHCVGDLLLRCHCGDLPADIVAIVSNHGDLKDLARRFDIPYFHVPHEGMDRTEHEAKILSILSELSFDYIVLAKYMRILSKEFSNRFQKKMINIHHSFLPAFIGAKPYHQAHERGVKVIGATSHFVTSDLDEGPIISQKVISVDHSCSAEKMRHLGRDVEKLALARALELILEGRVFVVDNRTVVFE
ncbi:MAG: formyltetrahydrofolate deformylase [bacterium]|nr:formyltetrahydrofolate deformylase [bacterium]